jgi:hypothetical protein
MSTISFPNPHSPSHHDSPSSAGTNPGHINFFPTSYDPQASASSFQINPLSSHPPRTPRTSILNASFEKEMYTSAEEHDERPLDDDEDVAKLESSAGKRVRKEDVWREMLSTSTGRDKALVCYSLYPGRRF